MKLPGTASGLGVRGPLLVHIRAGIREHPVVKLRVIPRHDQRCRGARTAAHCRATFGIFCELQVVLLLDQGQHFAFHKLRVSSRHRVVFEPALAALSVAAAVADGDRDHGRHPFLRNQIVQRRKQQRIGAVRADDEGRGGAGHCLGT